MRQRLGTFLLVLWSIALLVGAGIFVMVTMPEHPGASSVLLVGQSNLFFSSESEGDYHIDMSSGYMSATGNIGNGYVLYAYQSATGFLHVQLYHDNTQRQFGISPADGMCYIHVAGADQYFSFIVKDGTALVYRGQSSTTPCIEDKG